MDRSDIFNLHRRETVRSPVFVGACWSLIIFRSRDMLLKPSGLFTAYTQTDFFVRMPLSLLMSRASVQNCSPPIHTIIDMIVNGHLV